jgi:hypothetical protein
MSDQRLPSQNASTDSSRSAYPIRAIVIFLGLMGVLLIIRYFVPDRAFRDLPWLVVLALIPVFPWVLTWAQSMLSSLKLGPVEMTFLQVRISVEKVAQDLLNVSRDPTGQAFSIRQIANTMTSYGSVVIEKTRELAAIRASFLPLDLGAGESWVLPNLYFLAAMLESTTRVDLIIFTYSKESGKEKHRFLGSCSPENLRVRLGIALPVLEEARLWAQGPNRSLQTHFWSRVAELVDDTEPRWITAKLLANLLGQDLKENALDSQEVSTKGARQMVLFSDQRFVPVISGNEFQAVIDQHGSAINIARWVLSQ